MHDAQPARYPIFFFESDTSGEKPTEEFVAAQEKVELTRFDRLGVILPQVSGDTVALDKILSQLEGVLASKSVTKADVVEVLSAYLPTFQHIEKGRHLDQRM